MLIVICKRFGVRRTTLGGSVHTNLYICDRLIFSEERMALKWLRNTHSEILVLCYLVLKVVAVAVGSKVVGAEGLGANSRVMIEMELGVGQGV